MCCLQLSTGAQRHLISSDTDDCNDCKGKMLEQVHGKAQRRQAQCSSSSSSILRHTSACPCAQLCFMPQIRCCVVSPINKSDALSMHGLSNAAVQPFAMCVKPIVISIVAECACHNQQLRQSSTLHTVACAVHFSCRLQQLEHEATATLNTEVSLCNSDTRRLRNLLQTFEACDDANPPAAKWSLLNLVRNAGRAAYGLAHTTDAPEDTPHRQIASCMQEIGRLVDHTQQLQLDQTQTNLVHLTELARANILSVTSVVSDFIVRSQLLAGVRSLSACCTAQQLRKITELGTDLHMIGKLTIRHAINAATAARRCTFAYNEAVYASSCVAGQVKTHSHR